MSDFHGVFPYLISPIDEAGRIRESVLARLCDDLITSGVHGLTPLGSTGEFAYLNGEQREAMVLQRKLWRINEAFARFNLAPASRLDSRSGVMRSAVPCRRRPRSRRSSARWWRRCWARWLHDPRHARACPGHPRLFRFGLAKTWMAGTIGERKRRRPSDGYGERKRRRPSDGYARP